MGPLRDVSGDEDAKAVVGRAAAGRRSPTPGSGPTETGRREATIVVCSLLRRKGDTGVQTYVHAVEEHLDARGRPHLFVNPFTRRSLLRPGVFGARLAIRPLSRRLALWWYRYWHARYLERALTAVVRRSEPDTVLFAQCPVSADVALRVRTTQPVVLAVHFNVSQADEWVGKGDLRAGDRMFRAIRAFEERVLPRVDGIAYISAFARSSTEERIPALAGVAHQVLHGAVAARAEPRWAAHTPVQADLVTVGTLEPRKNQAYLLRVLHEAARQGHRYTLSIVGDGPERGRLEDLIDELGLSDQVRLVGYVPDARSLMAAHRVYCHTATMESFGLVLLEAMAEGRPVLAGAVGGVPEIVRPGVDGDFWPLDDPVAAAERLVALLEDPVRLDAMSRSAQRRAEQEFSPGTAGDRLLAFLDAAAGPRHGAAAALSGDESATPSRVRLDPADR